jgi:hypothetical protein
MQERKVNKKISQNDITHLCSYCELADDPEQTGPTWLFDRKHGKTIRVAVDLQGSIPQYQVLSYTWGRAASDSWETVEGVPWRVRSSKALPPERIMNLVKGSFSAQYVWVDIFCIPQECPVAKAWEVSRQQSIFRDASSGIAWLHQTYQVLPLYFGIYSWMLDIGQCFNTPECRPVACPDFALSRLKELLDDPWFSSSWTLQEAILQPKLMLGGEGETPRYGGFRPGDQTSAIVIESVSVLDFRRRLGFLLALAMESLHHLKRARVKSGTSHIRVSDAHELKRLVMSTGLSCLVSPGPDTIFIALATRTSVKEHDKYYGTQSIFGMRMLGDYKKPVEEVRGQFLEYIWGKYSPVLALALNDPIKDYSLAFTENCEMFLDYFSYSRLENSSMKSCPAGFSTVFVQYHGDDVLSFQSLASKQEGTSWRWEAREPQILDADSTKACGIYYGLPPLLLQLQRGEKTSVNLELSEPSPREESAIPLLRDTFKTYVKTTRLLYVGRLVSENNFLKLGPELHVYMEYFLLAPGTGRRVGAVCTSRPLKHVKVEGSLVMK